MKLPTQLTTCAIGTLSLLAHQALAQSCATTIAGNVPAPSTAPGVQANVVSANLQSPRGIIFDSAGHLLVIDRSVGVKALTLQDDGGACVSASDTKVVINDSTLNHGIELSKDGKTLYVSNVDKVFSYAYDPDTATVSGNGKVLISGMYNTDHSTRTMLNSRKDPNILVVNRGSQSNIDKQASNIKSGHGQVKAFDLSKIGNNPFDFTQDGIIMGWGIRNDVGIAEHPTKGGIWTVENSVDDIKRNGTDFHQQNPGEKLNYMGTLLNNKSPNKGSNFGYPECFAAWVPKAVPNAPGLKVGQQFSIDNSVSDQQCRQRTAPRLVFDAHTAPLDIKFNDAGGKAYVTFRGSHDRRVPKGYSVSRIDFNANGQPVAPSTSKRATHAIFGQANRRGCPSLKRCLRPVALAFDKKGRLFVSSDASGEVYVLTGV